MVIFSFGGDHGDAIVQVLRRDGGCQERCCARSPALSLSILGLQLHEYATQGQAGGDEGDGRAALRDGHMSFGMIGRILGVSDVSVLRWVAADVKVLVIDEMWHFVKKRQASFGSGAPVILSAGEPWPGFWVAVMMQPAADSSTRRERRG